MNSETDPEDDASYRYWKAAISCLSTPAKREAAEEFLRTRLEGGRGADTLFALILLLEANGAFLQSIPQRYDGELLQPLGDLLSSFRSEFQTQAERQRQTSRAISLAHDEIGQAATNIGQVSVDFESKLHAAVLGIDMKEVATRLSGNGATGMSLPRTNPRAAPMSMSLSPPVGWTPNPLMSPAHAERFRARSIRLTKHGLCNTCRRAHAVPLWMCSPNRLVGHPKRTQSKRASLLRESPMGPPPSKSKNSRSAGGVNESGSESWRRSS